MGHKKTPGLIKRAGIWHIDKTIGGRRFCQSTETAELELAEQVLARLIEEQRQVKLFGVRPSRTFEQAAIKFVKENQHKKTLRDDIHRLKNLMPWIGDLALDRIQMGSLHPWINHRRQESVAIGTINHGLQIVRRIVNLASSEWVDSKGLTWLLAPPKIKLLPNTTKKPPYPLDWQEQERLFTELPPHLADMALFAVNSGCRDGEICNLQWEWEIKVPQLDTSVFIIPGDLVKNSDDRLVVLNQITTELIERKRDEHPTHVFTYKGKPIKRIYNSAWMRARKDADLSQVRVHD